MVFDHVHETPFTEPKKKMKVLKVSFFVLEKTDLVDGVAMQRQRKLNEEVNDNLAVKREEGFIRCSRI